MKKLLFLLAGIMISFQISATPVDSSSFLELCKRIFREQFVRCNALIFSLFGPKEVERPPMPILSLPNKNSIYHSPNDMTFKKALKIGKLGLTQYKDCLKPTLSVSLTDFGHHATLNTPIAGPLLAQGLSFALCVPAPHLKAACLAALVAPYATEVCAKTTLLSMLRATNGDSSPMMANVPAQNTILATYGD